MKLQTSIQPRRDGTLKVSGQDRQTYEFAPGPDGELTGDVADEALVAQLLSTGNFWPADPEDIDSALKLVNDSDAEDPEDDPDAAADGLPVEAGTPPAPRRAGKAKAK